MAGYERVYILLGTADGRAEEAVRMLRGQPGVVMADAVEGPEEVLLVMESPDRETLSSLANRALALTEEITETVTLMPVRQVSNTAAAHRRSGRKAPRDRRVDAVPAASR